MKNLYDESFKVYKIKELSELLFVSEETIRKWIKNNELEAINLGSKKEGYIITSVSFGNFLYRNSKYTKRFKITSKEYKKLGRKYTVRRFILEVLYGTIPSDYYIDLVDNIDLIEDKQYSKIIPNNIKETILSVINLEQKRINKDN